MKRIIFGLLFILSLSLNSFSQINAMSGKWKEIWGYAQKSDVNYNDVFTLTIVDGNKLKISCESKPDYSFNNIDIKGDTLSFELRNSGYVLPYKLVLDANKTDFWGTAVNIHGEAVNIKWEKMPN